MTGKTEQTAAKKGNGSGKEAGATASPSEGQNENQKGPQEGTANLRGQQTPQSLDKVQAMGHAVWLMTQTPTHKHLFITDLEWALMPAIALGQFRLWRDGNLPVGFASWAFLSEEAEKRMIEGGVKKLAPTEWKSGDRIWMMDMIMPFGGADKAKAEILEKVFEGKVVKTLQAGPDGAVRVIKW